MHFSSVIFALVAITAVSASPVTSKRQGDTAFPQQAFDFCVAENYVCDVQPDSNKSTCASKRVTCCDTVRDLCEETPNTNKSTCAALATQCQEEPVDSIVGASS